MHFKWPLWLVALLAQVDISPRKPEALFPITIGGWIGLAAGLLGLVVALRKANNQPILDKIGQLEGDLKEAVRDLKEMHSLEIARLQNEFTNRLNGLGGRVTDTSNEFIRQGQIVNELDNKLVRSEEDRKQLNHRVGIFEGKMETTINMISNVERSLRDKIESEGKETQKQMRQQTTEILDSVSKMMNVPRNR